MELCVQRIKFLNAVVCVRMASNIKHLTKRKILDIMTNEDNCLINYVSENDVKILFKPSPLSKNLKGKYTTGQNFC